MILLAGYAVVGLAGAWRDRWVNVGVHSAGVAVAVVISFMLFKQTRTAQLPRWSASPDNPWVYAHTSADIFNLTNRMEEIAGIAGRKVHVQVVTADCWPLPWYLRGFERVGFFQSPPERLEGDVIIGDEKVWDRLEEKGYVPTSFGLRPGVVLWMYVREPLWEELRKKWASR
jgi:hypothetical protein